MIAEQYSFPADRYILIGKVTKTHGLKGELRVILFPGQAEDFSDYSRVALVATDGRMTALLELVKARKQGNKIILKLATIDTKNEADLTVGMGVLLLKEDMAEKTEQRLDLHQLIGCMVRTIDRGEIVGTVTAFFHNGAHEILVVRNDSEEHLIPLIAEIVVSYNDREILIDPPPGLLELAAEQ